MDGLFWLVGVLLVLSTAYAVGFFVASKRERALCMDVAWRERQRGDAWHRTALGMKSADVARFYELVSPGLLALQDLGPYHAGLPDRSRRELEQALPAHVSFRRTEYLRAELRRHKTWELELDHAARTNPVSSDADETLQKLAWLRAYLADEGERLQEATRELEACCRNEGLPVPTSSDARASSDRRWETTADPAFLDELTLSDREVVARRRGWHGSAPQSVEEVAEATGMTRLEVVKAYKRGLLKLHLARGKAEAKSRLP